MAQRITVVIGAGSGIGNALLRRMEAKGDLALGIDLWNAEILADISDPHQRATALEQVRKRTSCVNAVVCCAGVAPPALGANIVSVNYFGTVAMVEALHALLEAAVAPRVVVIASIAVLLPSNPTLVQLCLAGDEQPARQLAAQDAAVAYASSKLALARWVRRTAPQAAWAGRGILLNGVSPGTIRTPMAAALLASPEGRAVLSKAVPIAVGDYATPEDIAPLLDFLSSAENKFLVGQMPFVDGGSDVLIRGDAVL